MRLKFLPARAWRLIFALVIVVTIGAMGGYLTPFNIFASVIIFVMFFSYIMITDWEQKVLKRNKGKVEG